MNVHSSFVYNSQKFQGLGSALKPFNRSMAKQTVVYVYHGLVLKKQTIDIYSTTWSFAVKIKVNPQRLYNIFEMKKFRNFRFVVFSLGMVPVRQKGGGCGYKE